MKMENDNMEIVKTSVAIFVRVSSELQDYNRQINDLIKIAEKRGYQVAEVISEKISGAKTNEQRLGVQELLNKAKEGMFCKVMVSEVSRLGRSTLETLKLIEELHQLGICIYLQDLNIETLNENGEINFQTELMVHMLSLFSKNERRNLIDRIRSGMAEARKNGVHCGRYSGTGEEKEEFLRKYPKVVEGLRRGFSVRECVKLFDVSLGTVAKIRKYIQVELNQAA